MDRLQGQITLSREGQLTEVRRTFTGKDGSRTLRVKKFQYDIWGDTVNTASRMESSGEVGQVNISEATYELVKGNSEFGFTSRGKVEAKGKGELEMFFVTQSS